MTRRTGPLRTGALLIMSVLLLVGCGNATGSAGDTTDAEAAISEYAVIPEDSGPLASELRSAVPSEPTGQEAPLGGPQCREAGASLDPVSTVEVVITDGDITIDDDDITAGAVRFEVRNDGSVPHEALIVQAESPDALPLNRFGGIDESQILQGEVVGEVGTIEAGATCPGAFDVVAGEYLILCNVVEEQEGENLSHFAQGEVVSFTAS